MTTLSHDISYGMFSEVGNLAVHGIVVAAVTMNLTWPETYKCINMLAKNDYNKFGEAMDTTVAGVSSVFATYTHSQAANDALLRLSYMRYMAQKDGALVPTGVGMTSYNTSQVGTQVQVDLI